MLWRESTYFDDETRRELELIEDNSTEIEDRFYRDLEFGTGGLRGILGAGTNRMNIYMVRKATRGVAGYILKNVDNGAQRGAVIAYDSRRMSPEFAAEAAGVFAGNGIKAYLFDSLRPVPELSFAVRHLGAAAGVVVTASHNPKEYNGYKVYDEDGCQLVPQLAEKVMKEIDKIDDITSTRPMAVNEAVKKGLITFIGSDVDNEYMKYLKTLRINADVTDSKAKDYRVVYTPLHGTGYVPVTRILKETGFDSVMVVEEQAEPDPDFSTVRYPNPEDAESFRLAVELAKRENAGLIIGTDPDCDRVGVVAPKNDGAFEPLSGNQIGCLLLEYILSQMSGKGTLPPNGFVVTTIVSTPLASVLASHYGINMVEVLTGFKYIGEKIRELDEKGNQRFLFGFEESFGYLAGTGVRDKDGVVTSMLIAEAAVYYREKGMTIHEAMEKLYKKYGYFVEGIKSFKLEGKEGAIQIDSALSSLREDKPFTAGSFCVAAIRDYSNGIRYTSEGSRQQLELPRSNVLYFELEEDSWFCIRPSGTEPRIKIYTGVRGASRNESEKKLAMLKESVTGLIKPLLDL